MEALTPEMDSLKARLKGTWSAGDFGRIATSYEAGAADFIARLGLKPGQRVLDVGCGTGNLALPAAKAGAKVVGIDIAPNLVEQARQRAAAAGLDIQFDEGDAEALPCESGSFDAMVGMFGAMFAPRPDVVARELTRVTRPGGIIAMVNWTPPSFIGQMFKTIGALVPPPAMMPSPLLWGDELKLRERFGAQVADLRVQPRMIAFPFEQFTPARLRSARRRRAETGVAASEPRRPLGDTQPRPRRRHGGRVGIPRGAGGARLMRDRLLHSCSTLKGDTP